MNGRSIRAVWKALHLSGRQRSALPQTLIFFVTSRCNARCDFCLYYDQIENPVARELELKVDEVDRIARQYGPLHYLALSGGEPFVRKDVDALCQTFIDHCGVTVVDIPSNFYYTDTMLRTLEPLAGKNPGVTFDLQMSIDQVGAEHDASRQVKGLYGRALTTFRALAELRTRLPNLRLKINVVFLDRNKAALDDIVAELRPLAFDRLQVTYPHVLVPQEWNEDSPTARDVDAYIRAAQVIDEQVPLRDVTDVHTLGMRAVKRLYHRLLSEAVTNRRPVGSYCEAGRHIVVLNEKGDVFPCEPLWKSIGNLRDYDYDFRPLLHGDVYAKFRAEHLGARKCNCTWSCAMHTEISVTAAYLPSLVVAAGRVLLNQLTQSGRDARP